MTHTPSRYSYNQGCRCVGCTAANAAYKNKWTARRLAAKTHRLVHGYWLYVTPDGVDSGAEICGRGDARTPPDRGRNLQGGRSNVSDTTNDNDVVESAQRILDNEGR